MIKSEKCTGVNSILDEVLIDKSENGIRTGYHIFDQTFKNVELILVI